MQPVCQNLEEEFRISISKNVTVIMSVSSEEISCVNAFYFGENWSPKIYMLLQYLFICLLWKQ